MLNTRIEALKAEYNDLIEFFQSNKQVSFELYINDSYKKSLLLSAASYFEAVIIDIIIEYAKFCSNYDEKIVSLIEGKALSRQYHTLFDWDKQNANKFFSLFGDATREFSRKQLQNKDLLDAEKAFLTIGRERNKLVHKNYVEVIIDYTFDEIYEQYRLACDFVDFIREILPNC